MVHDQGRSYATLGESGSIGHGYSTDCVHWRYGNVSAASTTVNHTDGTSTTYMKRERPHLTFSTDGAMTPLGLFTGIQDIDQNNPQPPHCTWANHRNKSLSYYCDPAFTSFQKINGAIPTAASATPVARTPQSGTLVRGGAPCKSDSDCQLNGVCTKRACACDAAWTGANCSYLFSLPTKGAAFPAAVGSKTTGADSGSTSSWGGRPVLGSDGIWHLFVATFAASCGIDVWHVGRARPPSPPTRGPTLRPVDPGFDACPDRRDADALMLCRALLIRCMPRALPTEQLDGGPRGRGGPRGAV